MPPETSSTGFLLKSHRLLTGILTVLLLTGMITLIQAASGLQAKRAWQAYHINFIFWLGLSHASLVYVAVLNITRARWGRPFKRFAEALGTFSPVSFLLFWILYLGREEVFPWILAPVAEKARWLNTPFLFTRNGIGLFLLSGVSTGLIFASVMKEPSRRIQNLLSPILAILYCLVLSLAAFDLIMSLDPHWYSTLFGGYYFISSFYCGLAGVALLTSFYLAYFNPPGEFKIDLQTEHYHDLGKLIFGFCLMTGYLFFTQFLVIWYGNVPEETRYLIERFRHKPWKPLGWITLGITFVLPFIILLSRKMKMRSGVLGGISLLILAGMWIERFLLVAPSLWRDEGLPLGFTEILITAGFFGLISLTVLVFLDRYPPIPRNDPFYQEESE